MKRRAFIRTSASVSLATGALFSMGEWHSLLAAETPNLAYDLVAVKNAVPALMFDSGIAALGGMKQYVKPGQRVVIKPNIAWDVPPERGSNTNPELVGQIVKHCMEAGAGEVKVFDHTCDEWTRCYSSSGIGDAVKKHGGSMVNGNDEKEYRSVSIPKGRILKETRVHRLILESDVLINVPVLKNHGGAKLTVSMKNLMGVVWERRPWHSMGLHQCIADFSTFCKPTLNVVDGYRVMKKNGPRGVSEADVAEMKYLILSANMVAADAAAAKIFGIEPADVQYIVLAEQAGLGTAKLDTLNIKRIAL